MMSYQKKICTRAFSLLSHLPLQYRKSLGRLIGLNQSTVDEMIQRRHSELPNNDKAKELLSCKKLWMLDYEKQYALLHTLLMNACTAGELQTVAYLLTSPEIPVQADIQYQEQHKFTGFNVVMPATFLSEACRTGRLAVVKYLLTSPDLAKKADIHWENDFAIIKACESNQVHIVQYLLNEPQSTWHKETLYNVLMMACASQHFEIIDLVLAHSPEVIHAGNEQVFKRAWQQRNFRVINHLLVHHELEMTPSLEAYCCEQPEFKQSIENILENKKLQQKLTNNLAQKPSRARIKL